MTRRAQRRHEDGREHRVTRVVRFDHDPVALLGALADGGRPEAAIARGEYYVALEFGPDGFNVVPLDADAVETCARVEP